MVLTTLKPTTRGKSKLPKNATLSEEPEIMYCDKCNYETVSASCLRKYIIKEHSANIFHGLEVVTQAIEHNVENFLANRNPEPVMEVLVDKPVIEAHEEECIDSPEQTIEEIANESSVEPPEFSCNKCDVKISNRSHYEKHLELYSYADNLSLAFHVCRTCNKVVNKKDPNIQCSKCIYFFHKKCTNKKDARGNWKPSLWSCQICSPIERTNPSIQTLNPGAETFPDPASKQSTLGTRIKLSALTGRQRKSNINLENPEKEYLN